MCINTNILHIYIHTHTWLGQMFHYSLKYNVLFDARFMKIISSRLCFLYRYFTHFPP